MDLKSLSYFYHLEKREGKGCSFLNTYCVRGSGT